LDVPSPGPSTLLRPTRDRALGLAWLVAGCLLVVELVAVATKSWAIDSAVYWAVWSRPEMYSVPPGEPGAFLYSPLFAQAIAPLTLLPWSVFAAVWLSLGVASYIWLVRPLRWVWSVPLAALALEDLRVGNVTWLITICAVAGMTRGAPWLGVVGTKLAPAVALGWFVVRREGRPLLEAAVTVVAVVGASVLAAPALWSQWWALLTCSHSTGAMVRLGLAAGLVVVAARRGWLWLLPCVLILASPIPGLYTIASFCALPRLLSPEALSRAAEPFGGFRTGVRRALDLQPRATREPT
jgi:hypothetical protein